MALITTMDSGNGFSLEQAYLRISKLGIFEQYLENTIELVMRIEIYGNKFARERAIISAFVNKRNQEISIPVPYDKELANSLGGASEEEWHQAFDKGPWTAEETLQLNNGENFAGSPAKPISSYLTTFSELIVPELVDILQEHINSLKENRVSLKKRIYPLIKNGSLTKQTLTNPFNNTCESFDDFETVSDIIKKWIDKYPFLSKNIEDIDNYIKGLSVENYNMNIPQ